MVKQKSDIKVTSNYFEPEKETFTRKPYWVPSPLRINIKVQPDSANDEITQIQSVLVLLRRKSAQVVERYCYSEQVVPGTVVQIHYRQHKLIKKPDGKFVAELVPASETVPIGNLRPKLIWARTIRDGIIKIEVLERRMREEGVLTFDPSKPSALDGDQKRKLMMAYDMALDHALRGGDQSLSRLFNTSASYTQVGADDSEDNQFMSIIKATPEDELVSGSDIDSEDTDDLFAADPADSADDIIKKAQKRAKEESEEQEAPAADTAEQEATAADNKPAAIEL